MRIGALRRGDYLVMDNASVHTGSTLGWQLQDLFEQYGVIQVALPTYSPELNPCELVFANMKRFIRSTDSQQIDSATQREIIIPFAEIIKESLDKISYTALENMYAHCRVPDHC
jgi:transposase